MKMPRSNFSKIWTAPLIIAGISIFGLLSALLGTGIWHWLSWLAMLAPLLVFAICLKKR
jgi:hypothetical protein